MLLIMNKPEAIYNFLVNIEKNIYKNKRPTTSYIFNDALNIKEFNNVKTNHLRLQIANYIYDLVDFIKNEQNNLNNDWSQDLINVLTYPLEEDSQLLIQKLRSLFPHAKNFIASQIKLWENFYGKSVSIEKDQIEVLKVKTEELIKQFNQLDNIENTVRNFIIRNLKKTNEILDHYQIFGNEDILNVLETSIGHSFTNSAYQSFMKSNNSDKWRNYLSDLSIIVTTSQGALSISTALQNLLP